MNCNKIIKRKITFTFPIEITLTQFLDLILFWMLPGGTCIKKLKTKILQYAGIVLLFPPGHLNTPALVCLLLMVAGLESFTAMFMPLID